ncbi:hypothetical protein A2680_02645 [Candidatus Kaiserbacteria bacterium RIFCSPHIGHO2_01_FULL_55_37]|nr:MAG: hypothetical protein A2680_02645 [Candidatus Kaiserbacteria bacterium RIFCSPHIGHO2_01_FULL_55_37]
MFGFKKRIYLDYASATPVHPKAARALSDAMGVFANPGALHSEGVLAKGFLTASRERIAKQLGCKARELIFTSGLTESNTIAIVGAARALEVRRRFLEGTHWVVSAIEHSSVLECFAEVERMGGKVTHVYPDKKGLITPEEIAKALRPDTVFISIGWGNNEIGTVQPLSGIARALHRHEKGNRANILFHSDAGQAPLYLSPQVNSLGVDLFSLGSGKLYGPRGVGALHLSNRVSALPVTHGGGQERGLRPGTEEPALAAGFAKALDLITLERDAEVKRLRKLRDDFAREIVARIPGTVINGDLKHTLPHMLNVSIPGERTGEYLVLALDHAGLSLSTKSACREGEADSHVVVCLAEAEAKAGNKPVSEWRARNTLRFSLGRDTTAGDLKRALSVLKKISSC